MAKKANKNTKVIESSADIVKKQIKNLHTKALINSDKFVEESLATGEEWQKIFAKALKGGTKLFAKQQEIALDTIEKIKGQVIVNNGKLINLLDLKVVEQWATEIKKSADEVLDKATEATKEVSATAQKMTKKLAKEAKKATAKANKATKSEVKTTATKKAKAVTKKVKATAKKVAKKKATVKKVVAKKVTAKKAAVKKTATKKVASKKVVAKKDDLTIIIGIGPKIQTVLKQEGISTFKQLSTTSISKLNTILTEAGPRFKMCKPANWKAEAKLAANGKFDLLKEFQKQNK